MRPFVVRLRLVVQAPEDSGVPFALSKPVGPENVDRIARLIAELEAMCERAKELRRELKASYSEPPVWPDRRRVGRRFNGSTLPSSNNPPSDSDETVN